MQSEKGWFVWRLLALLGGMVLIVLPVVLPIIELLLSPDSWKVWAEVDRIQEMLVNTVIVALSSSLLAIFLGSITALLLIRTSLAARWMWGSLLTVGLFIPLPMLLSGWY